MFFWTPTQAARKLSEVYDEISEEFAATRKKNWLELELLFRDTKPGVRILDLGCGSGRLLPLFLKKKCRVTGIDASEKLLHIARQQYPQGEFWRGDFAKIPTPDETFDEVWAIASLHHVPNDRTRSKTFREIFRVLKPHGHLVLTVWNLWEQPKYAPQKKSAWWRSLFFPAWKKWDFLIPWGGRKIPRYYHAFQVAELKKLARKNSFSVIECWGLQQEKKGKLKGARNVCMRLKKGG